MTRIETNGRVKKDRPLNVRIIEAVDDIAVSAARECIFEPALDDENKPMECEKVITF